MLLFLKITVEVDCDEQFARRAGRIISRAQGNAPVFSDRVDDRQRWLEHSKQQSVAVTSATAQLAADVGARGKRSLQKLGRK